MIPTDRKWARGELFALLSEADGNGCPEWQSKLRASLGGRCVRPLHISCQKVSPTDGAQVADIVQIYTESFQHLSPITVEGRRVEVWYSGFRESGIAKCIVPVNAELNEAITRANHGLDGIGVERHYHVELVPDHVPVTVLDGLAPDTAVGEADHRSVQQTIFTAGEFLISRWVDLQEFEILLRRPLS